MLEERLGNNNEGTSPRLVGGTHNAVAVWYIVVSSPPLTFHYGSIQSAPVNRRSPIVALISLAQRTHSLHLSISPSPPKQLRDAPSLPLPLPPTHHSSSSRRLPDGRPDDVWGRALHLIIMACIWIASPIPPPLRSVRARHDLYIIDLHEKRQSSEDTPAWRLHVSSSYPHYSRRPSLTTREMAALAGPSATFLPTIKCSDCSVEIEISRMSEHVCSGVQREFHIGGPFRAVTCWVAP
jgi:hypothetical protein